MPTVRGLIRVGGRSAATYECCQANGSGTARGAVSAAAASCTDANISITLDRYGHLKPGNEAEAAEMLDVYLQRAS